MQSRAASEDDAGVRHCDLGTIDGAVTLFGGPYSNLQALEALAGVVQGEAICTGDLVAYCADPMASVARVRAMGAAVVAGNCERQLAAGALDCGCGFDTGSTCDLLSGPWYAHARAELTPDVRDWMASLPDVISFRHAGARYAVIHGGMTDISRFLWPTSPEVDFATEIGAIEAAIGAVDAVIAGHCGLAFERRIGAHWWINAGAIGMPPNDGDVRGAYAILAQGQLTFHRLRYDHTRAAAAMRAAKLTQGYERALETGYWPSEDVLPVPLRRAARASGCAS